MQFSHLLAVERMKDLLQSAPSPCLFFFNKTHWEIGLKLLIDNLESFQSTQHDSYSVSRCSATTACFRITLSKPQSDYGYSSRSFPFTISSYPPVSILCRIILTIDISVGVWWSCEKRKYLPISFCERCECMHMYTLVGSPCLHLFWICNFRL